MPNDKLRLTEDIDPAIGAVEIKITARVENEDQVRSLLAKAGEEPEERAVYSSDSPGLTLFDAGLVLRARRVKGDEDDSTVKLRPVEPSSLASEWLETDGFEVEMDRVGEQEVISAKLSATQRRGEIDEAVGGEAALQTLFSKDQERLVVEFGPDGVDWDALVALGSTTGEGFDD